MMILAVAIRFRPLHARAPRVYMPRKTLYGARLVLVCALVFIFTPAHAQTGGFLSSGEASSVFEDWDSSAPDSSDGSPSPSSASLGAGYGLASSPQASSHFSSFSEHEPPSRPIRSSSSRFVVVELSVPRSDSLLWRTHSYTSDFYAGTYGPSPTDDETTLWFTSSYEVLRTALSDITGDSGLGEGDIFDGISPGAVVLLSLVGTGVLVVVLYVIAILLSNMIDGGECCGGLRRLVRRCKRKRAAASANSVFD